MIRMATALTLKRCIGEIVTRLEVPVYINERDVDEVADRLCETTYLGFILECWTPFP